MARMITRPMRLAMSMPNAQEGRLPPTRLIITTMRENMTMAVTKIEIHDTSALGGVRFIRMLWEQVLDKADSRLLQEEPLINSGWCRR